MKWDWIFFDADETLFTFDSFTGLQRMFLDCVGWSCFEVPILSRE